MMNTLFIIRHAPYQSLVSREAVDAMMVCASFGATVDVLFMAEGVWQLRQPTENHNDALAVTQQKNISKNWQALPLFDIPDSRTHVCSASLEAHGLVQTPLILNPQRVTHVQIQSLIHSAAHVVTF